MGKPPTIEHPPMSALLAAELQPRIALIGLSGSGKSSTGRLLAAQLGWVLCDTDDMVMRATGRTIAQVFAEEGEVRFREREADALQEALVRQPCVIATGGGIVLRAANRSLLHQHAVVIWLDAPIETLLSRLRAHDEERPLLKGSDPAAQLAALRTAREALYATTAHLRIETGTLTNAHICEQVYRFYRTR